MKLKHVVSLALFLCTNSIAYSYEPKTGNQYYGFLKSPQTVDSLMAMEYMHGVIDAKRSTYCIPAGVTPSQLIEVVTKHIEQQPEKRHLAAPLIIEAAIKKAFPCR